MKTQLIAVVLAFWSVAAIGVQYQKKSTVNKDARLFVEHYEQTDHSSTYDRVDYQSGVFWMDDKTEDTTLTWDDGEGGKQPYTLHETFDSTFDGSRTFDRTTENDWPPTRWRNLPVGTFSDSAPPGDYEDGGPHPPVIIFQYRDLQSQANFSFPSYDPVYGYYIEHGHVSRTSKAQIKIKFYAGGLGLPKRKSVYQAMVTAVAHNQIGVDSPYNTPYYGNTPIPSQNIKLGDLGYLDPDGILYAVIPEGGTADVTPKVKEIPYYTFSEPILSKYTLASKVACVALTDKDPERKSLGVAEVVSIGTLPDETRWDATAASDFTVGTLSSDRGSTTILTAPYSADNCTVTATIRKARLTLDFNVVEPSGIQASTRSLEPFSAGYVGAGMYVNVTVNPTTVSFSKIEMEEPGHAATGLTGYFLLNPPPAHDAAHGADAWHPVNCSNLIMGPPRDYFDHAWSAGWPIGTVGGSYTWPIQPIWRVVGDTATHPLNGWTDQVMKLDPDGTMRVDKFGLHVIRHP